MPKILPIFLLLALLSNVTWLFSQRKLPTPILEQDISIEIPKEYQAIDLNPLPKTNLEKEFSRSFPGQIATYQNQDGMFIFRQVKGATRKLHNTSTCLTASGYKLSPVKLTTDDQGRTWSIYKASYEGEQLIVKTIILELNGDNSWSNVEAWFWSASFAPSETTYLAISEINPL